MALTSASANLTLSNATATVNIADNSGFLQFVKTNLAVLGGGGAGSRSHSGPSREAAKEIGSSVPWVGFPVGYAVSGVLLTVFGYFAMVLSQ